jgi:hypothetical protein
MIEVVERDLACRMSLVQRFQELRLLLRPFPDQTLDLSKRNFFDGLIRVQERTARQAPRFGAVLTDKEHAILGSND